MHRDWEHVTGRRRAAMVAGHIGLGILAALALAAAFGWGVMLLWNAVMPDVLGARPVTYWQAFGLLVLARLLVGGFHGHGGRGHRRCRRIPPNGRHDAALEQFVERGRPEGTEPGANS